LVKTNRRLNGVEEMFFMLRLKYLLFKHELVDKCMRRKYCHKGFHKLTAGYLATSGTETKFKWKRVYYLKCLYCNYLFFASKSNKQKYLDMTAKERSAFRGLLSSSLLKHTKRVGCEPKKDASASSNK